MIFKLNQKGQALFEYLLLIVFLMLLSGKMVSGFNEFLANSVGNLGHVLSLNLSVGVCPRECYFGDYRNGFKP